MNLMDLPDDDLRVYLRDRGEGEQSIEDFILWRKYGEPRDIIGINLEPLILTRHGVLHRDDPRALDN